MQINGAQLANLFVSRPSGLEDKARAPVIIEGTSFKVENAQQQAPVIARPLSQETILFDNVQQSRFIRSFSASRDEPSSEDSQQVIKSSPLTQAVQQYLQVAQISDENNQKLLDEMV